MDLFTLMGKIAIESGNSSSEIDNMIEQAQTLQNMLNGTAGSSEEASQSIVNSTTQAASGTNKALSSMQVMLGNLATQGFNKVFGYGKSFLQTGFEFNQNMEKWTASFKTYLGGDLEAASAFMEEVKQFAVETPLSLSDSVQGAVRLMASGIDSGNVIDTLTMLGDIANGDTEKMSRLALVYSQVMSAGKLGGNDPIQFKEAGVPIYDLLEQYYAAQGISYEGTLADLQKEGGILSEHVHGALQMATSEGGMYFNAMNNIMDTEYGQAQKMMDLYEQAAGSFTKAIFDVFASDTIPALNEILQQLNDWATENPEALEHLGEAFSNFATGGLQVLLDGLMELLTFWNDHQAEFNSMLVLLGGIALYTGHPVAGTALIATGAIDAYTEAKNQMEGGSAVGQYLNKDPEIQAAVENETTEELTGTDWFNYHVGGPMVQFFHDLFPGLVVDPSEVGLPEVHNSPSPEDDANSEEGVSGSLKQLNENMHNLSMLFASASGVPEGKSEDTGSATTSSWVNDNLRALMNGRGYGSGIGAASVDLDSVGGVNTGALAATLAAMQGVLASLPSQIESAASKGVASGVSGITVTGTVTTGAVKLDTGALVGQITPRINMQLGTLNRLSGRS